MAYGESDVAFERAIAIEGVIKKIEEWDERFLFLGSVLSIFVIKGFHKEISEDLKRINNMM